MEETIQILKKILELGNTLPEPRSYGLYPTATTDFGWKLLASIREIDRVAPLLKIEEEWSSEYERQDVARDMSAAAGALLNLALRLYEADLPKHG